MGGHQIPELKIAFRGSALPDAGAQGSPRFVDLDHHLQVGQTPSSPFKSPAYTRKPTGKGRGEQQRGRSGQCRSGAARVRRGSPEEAVSPLLPSLPHSRTF
jgi:hypothetical protein